MESCLKPVLSRMSTSSGWLRLPENTENTLEDTSGLPGEGHPEASAMSAGDKEGGWGGLREAGPHPHPLPDLSQSWREFLLTCIVAASRRTVSLTAIVTSCPQPCETHRCGTVRKEAEDAFSRDCIVSALG